MRMLLLAAATTLALGGFNSAAAQTKAKGATNALQGHWTLLSIENMGSDGKATPGVFGPNPKGVFIFEPSGRYSIQIFRQDLPKFAAKSREKGTADENKAVVAGTLSHFGTYKVNQKESSFTILPEASSYPNWTGTEQPARKFAVKGDQLTIANPAPSAGSGTAVLTLKRAK